ncbi:hypothetical protein T4B_6380 [Trichinella pseudospiralis]|uniref:Uncharacterized protein n=1 Tax=Trichinella pseudospiralis TaxID=6337 RepID=A0A0V1H1J3_TRIPS|nr:hypothetical protein T4A_6661 [Trichinella pseudospiralis]KRY67548.1 hypothetical protein T4A_13229 [Trichinella pseudospiralis]KRY68782.1 hypothetical protein T4A_10972 [Trichinella pseudospiralis]KRZ04432.1 hypothetical protein T4B_6380 [Trichinella pseudospiralis]KRZ35539.1 hypothetical protein T4C_3510 [Trichinella pseudospiralis]
MDTNRNLVEFTTLLNVCLFLILENCIVIFLTVTMVFSSFVIAYLLRFCRRIATKMPAFPQVTEQMLQS